MTDLASLGIRVESQEADVADKRLDDLAVSAGRAEKSVDSLANAARRADGATSTMNVAVRQQAQMLNVSRNAMGLTVTEGLNLSRQFADIGVTAAMGMNPLMIAIQQGPQLLDIFQTAAARTGTTVRAAFMASATAAYAMLAPFIAIAAAAAAAAAVIGGALSLATRGANKEFGDLEKGLGLTDEQLKKVKDTSIGMGDIVVATFQEVGEAILDAFDGPIKSAQKATTSFLDDLTANTIKEVKVVVGAFVGAYDAIRATWRLLPAAIGDAAYSAANATVNALNFLIRKSVEGINSLRAQYNSLPAWMRGGQAAPMLAAPQLGGAGNPYAGGMAAVGNVGGAAFSSGSARGAGYVDAGIDAIGRRARDNQVASIRSQAGDADSDGSDTARRTRAARENVEVMREVAAINWKPSNAQLELQLTILRATAKELDLINNLARDSAQGLASAFGESGRAMGDLLTTMTDYQSRLADIALAERENQLSASQADRERAHAQIASYGDMLGAAKGFFKEGSDGYKALQAAEAAYRVFQFAMSVQAMAQNAAETGVSVGGSLAKGAASAAAGAAKMFEALGPFAFPVVGAMLALLASIGLKGGGGGGGGSSTAANDNGLSGSVARSQGQSAQQDQGRQSIFEAVAQKIDVRISADQNGIHGYIVDTAAETAQPMIERGMAATGGATRAQVMQDLSEGRTYSRSGG